MKFKRHILILLITVFVSCDGENELPSFPTESDLTGFWRLEAVMNGSINVPLDEYSHLLNEQFLRLSDDKSFQEVSDKGFSSFAKSGNWFLEEDILNLNHQFISSYQVVKASRNELELRPGTAGVYSLTYKKMEAADFPEHLFSVIHEGERIRSTEVTVDVFDTSFKLSSDKDGFWLIVTLPKNAIAGQVLSITDTNPDCGVRLLFDDADYNIVKSG
ncbi:MAG: hypothetical protein RIB63_07645, partial [Fulvivirga sp.]